VYYLIVAYFGRSLVCVGDILVMQQESVVRKTKRANPELPSDVDSTYEHL
jgi:hypothetical protein